VFSTIFTIRYEDVPDQWKPPEPQPYVEQGNLHYYMLDPDAYDQYCTVTGGGNTVQIWQNTSPEPTLLEERAVRIRLVTEGFEYQFYFID
jgi:translation initiation factor 3 subunit B